MTLVSLKYLGLRLFAHDWGPNQVNPVFQKVYELNQAMIARTKAAEKSCTNQQGNCDYNLTLINYMEPINTHTLGLKDDVSYGMGKVSVSWHSDSALQDFSSIGVYHCLPQSKKCDWKIALRRTQRVAAKSRSRPL